MGKRSHSFIILDLGTRWTSVPSEQKAGYAAESVCTMGGRKESLAPAGKEIVQPLYPLNRPGSYKSQQRAALNGANKTVRRGLLWASVQKSASGGIQTCWDHKHHGGALPCQLVTRSFMKVERQIDRMRTWDMTFGTRLKVQERRHRVA
jgi:hypothetical protein